MVQPGAQVQQTPSVPHFKSPLHWSSMEQPPSPTSQGQVEEQPSAVEQHTRPLWLVPRLMVLRVLRLEAAARVTGPLNILVPVITSVPGSEEEVGTASQVALNLRLLGPCSFL